MSKRDEKAAQPDKKKGKKGKGKSGESSGLSVAAHPRASYQVRRAKGWGGIAGYMLAWTCAVTVWRHLVLAELRAAADRAVAAVDPADLIPARASTPAKQPDPGAGPTAAARGT